MIAPPGNPSPGRRAGVRFLPALALALLAASGCSSGASTPTAAVSTVTGTPGSPAAVTAAPSGGSLSSVASGSARTPSSVAGSVAPGAPSAGGSGTAAARTPSAPSVAGLPRAADPRQGGRYWAVLGALSTDIEDPKLTAAEQQFRGLGYAPGRGEIDCLQGAREALKVKGDAPYYEVDVMFSTQKQAEQVAARFGGKAAGVARVTAFCLD